MEPLIASGMEPGNLALDPRWAVGLVLALTRVGAFVAASPLLSRSLPMVGRLMAVLALGLFLTAPVTPPSGLAGLVGLAVMNAAVGVVLGFLTGLLFHLFAVAGDLLDVSSGLSVATIYDPGRGEQSAVFSRLFNLVALTAFVVAGGLGLFARGLALSTQAIPLGGAVAPHAGLVQLTLRLLGQMTVAAVELALPVLAALFLAEIVLGLASRLAPQANILLLGMPAKILVALSLVGASLLLFPEALRGVLDAAAGTFTDVLRGLAA